MASCKHGNAITLCWFQENYKTKPTIVNANDINYKY